MIRNQNTRDVTHNLSPPPHKVSHIIGHLPSLERNVFYGQPITRSGGARGIRWSTEVLSWLWGQQK